jgi:hypothetical protein
MRRVVYALVVVAFALSAAAAPSEGREPRERERWVPKTVKKIVRALGDLITVPIP